MLIDESAGDDDTADRVWARWRREGLVEATAGRWRATTALAGRDRRFDDILPTLPVTARVGRELLWLGALFGRRFCATSVVAAHQAFFGGHQGTDPLQDAFDELAEAGVVERDGLVRGLGGTACWIYRFASRGDHARALRLIERIDATAASRAVLLATSRLHWDAYPWPLATPGPSPAELLDRPLTLLARALQVSKIATHHAARADRAVQVEELEQYVVLLLASARVRAATDDYPLRELEAAAQEAFDRGELKLARAAISEALRIAEALRAALDSPAQERVVPAVMASAGREPRRPGDRSYALLERLAGHIDMFMGMHQDALPRLRHVQAYFSRQDLTQVGARRDLAIAEGDLALSVREVDGHAAALPGLHKARDLSQQLADDHPSPTHRRGLAIAEHDLAFSVREVDGHDAALPGLHKARDLSQQLADDHPSPTHHRDLAIAERDLNISVREVDGDEEPDRGPRAGDA